MSDDLELCYDVVVVGGGLSGVCAAISSARAGARTVLVHDRPVLGGNSSMEIGVKVQGADELGNYRHARETGLIDELYQRNVDFPNPFQSPSIWSVVLWEACREQGGLDVYMNTVASVSALDGGRIISIRADQSTTERSFKIRGSVFIDCSGDGRIGFEAGAPFMMGREAAEAFGESLAEPEADSRLMGCTVFIKARDAGRPIPFRAPEWAHVFERDEDLPGALMDCPHAMGPLLGTSGGYWWIEYGGELDPFKDAERTRDELYRFAIGVWDHIKNRGNHGADNLVLDSVGCVPGRRDSRRFIGDYILTQSDVESGRVFPDAVAYGGWHIDLHNPKGISAAPERYWKGHLLQGRYTIPYRSLYSKVVTNLLVAGRLISASHVAFGSARVMATCALIGQAAGNAAGICIERACLPRDVYQCHMGLLQRRLLDQDCHLPGIGLVDEEDLAVRASVAASSQASLVFPRVEAWRPVRGGIAQGFFVSEGRLDVVRIGLRNLGMREHRVDVRLHPARAIDDFTDDSVLASSSSIVRVGEHEVDFTLACPGLVCGAPYWIEVLCDVDDIHCGYSVEEPPATQAGLLEPQLFEVGRSLMRRMRGSYCIQLFPEMRCYGPDEVVSGVMRPEARSNMWMSEMGLPQSISVSWPKPVSVAEINLVFDHGLDRTLAQWCHDGVAPILVRDFEIRVVADGVSREVCRVRDNGLRHVVVRMLPVSISELTLEVTRTWGAGQVRVLAVRCYPRWRDVVWRNGVGANVIHVPNGSDATSRQEFTLVAVAKPDLPVFHGTF